MFVKICCSKKIAKENKEAFLTDLKCNASKANTCGMQPIMVLEML